MHRLVDNGQLRSAVTDTTISLPIVNLYQDYCPVLRPVERPITTAPLSSVPVLQNPGNPGLSCQNDFMISGNPAKGEKSVIILLTVFEPNLFNLG